MAGDLHVVKRPDDGWAVRSSGSARAATVHRTQAEAAAAARRLALKHGGAEVVIHRHDGSIRSVDTVGAAELDRRKREQQPPPAARAPRSGGARTTLRVPSKLAELADALSRELGISRNDALLRLATRGAQLYELERQTAARREARWAAVVPGVVDVDAVAFPSPEEARRAVLEPDHPDSPVASSG